jgi:hypothetical protein
LIKGQIVDLEAERPQKLRQKLPVAEHQVIYLDAGLDEVFQRVPRKSWATGKETREVLQDWREKQFKLLRNLVNFQFLALSSKTGDGYKQIPLPKELEGLNANR